MLELFPLVRTLLFLYGLEYISFQLEPALPYLLQISDVLLVKLNVLLDWRHHILVGCCDYLILLVDCATLASAFKSHP